MEQVNLLNFSFFIDMHFVMDLMTISEVKELFIAFKKVKLKNT